jgi:voltage-gated potassium channel
MTRLSEHKHLLLLVAIITVLITQPLVARDSAAARFAYDMLVAAVAVSVFLVVFAFRWERQVAVVLALPAIALGAARYALTDGAIAAYAVSYFVSAALFLAFAVAVIVRDIFRSRSISFDAVLGAFGGYLLLGVASGSLYAAAELLAPGSFSVNAEIRWQLENWHLRRALFNYFSSSTMAGLGYSDITAVAPITNTLRWLEVMTVQFYLAVVIAQIVGLKLAQTVGSAGEGRGAG